MPDADRWFLKALGNGLELHSVPLMNDQLQQPMIVSSAVALVFVLGCAAWVLPVEAGSFFGSWLLPTLAFAGLGLSLWLVLEWRWLRGLSIVFSSTLVLAWIRADGSLTATSHFAGASFGLLAMVGLGRFVNTVPRLRFATLSFLSSGLVVLILGLASTAQYRWASTESIVYRLLPEVRLGLFGLEANGEVNLNAVVALALLVSPLGVAVLSLKSNKAIDSICLRPLGFVVFLVGTYIVIVSRSRTAGIAIWLTLAVLLVRGMSSWKWRAMIGSAVAATPILVLISIGLITQEEFVAQANSLWAGLHDRIHVMNSAMEHFKGSPWFGIGLNQFRHVYLPAAELGEYDVAHAHNLYLQTAMDLGVFGLAAYGGLIAFVLTRANRVIRHASSTLGAVAALGGALSLIVISLFGLGDAVALGAKVGLFQWMSSGLVLSAWRIHAQPAKVP